VSFCLSQKRIWLKLLKDYPEAFTTILELCADASAFKDEACWKHGGKLLEVLKWQLAYGKHREVMHMRYQDKDESEIPPALLDEPELLQGLALYYCLLGTFFGQAARHECWTYSILFDRHVLQGLGTWTERCLNSC
jgi:hypothetical protein